MKKSSKRFSWKKWIRSLHRDAGYFFSGMLIVYALSGLAFNHRDDWNPNFCLIEKDFATPLRSEQREQITTTSIKKLLNTQSILDSYRGHAFPSPYKLKIFTKKGSVFVDLDNGKAHYEALSPRPLFNQVNFLHTLNSTAWKVFSDCFCIGLFIITITGLCLVKGKRGIKGRGGIYLFIGILIPVLFIVW